MEHWRFYVANVLVTLATAAMVGLGIWLYSLSVKVETMWGHLTRPQAAQVAPTEVPDAD